VYPITLSYYDLTVTPPCAIYDNPIFNISYGNPTFNPGVYSP